MMGPRGGGDGRNYSLLGTVEYEGGKQTMALNVGSM